MSSTIFRRLAILMPAFFVFAISSFSQGLFPVSFDNKVQNSDLIVEGRVTDQHSFWDPQHRLIYTSNTVEVYKIFKGSLTGSTIEVLTVGGSVGLVHLEVSELLSLSKGDEGVFFCHPNNMQLRSPATNTVMMDVWSSAQGFYKYDFAYNAAAAPFEKYEGIEARFYPEIESRTGRSFENKKPSFTAKPRATQNRLFAPTGISFSPAVVNAGAILDPATNLLTITGTGFGNPAGPAAIFFDDANDGSGGSFWGVAYNDPLVVSWTDTEIQVRVPSRAGTGLIAVRDEFGDMTYSTDVLQVNYSILTSTFSSGGTFTKERNQMNTNGSGGYSVRYSTNTANNGIDFNAATAEKEAFQRALNTWREVTGWNVVEGGTTTAQTPAADGINVITFDNTATGSVLIPAGVLGVCYSWSSACLPLASNAAQLIDFDVVLRSNISAGGASFTVGPCPPASTSFSELDLETVILHELGHAIGLGHINANLQGSSLPNINPGMLMNFSLVNGVRRSSPDFSALSGAMYSITPQGNTYGVCGLFTAEMSPLTTTIEPMDECPTFPVTPLPPGTVLDFDLSIATSNVNTDPQYTGMRCDGSGTGITNTAYYAFLTPVGFSDDINLTVLGYTTDPGSLAACPPNGSYSTSGVELAIYQVNSCPAGQAFPAPIACRTFNGNGSLAPITGISANTNYLIVVDGIENTKASFSLSFAGTTLPVELISFTGEAKGSTSLLKWQTSSEQNNDYFDVETSKDGTNFYNIGKVDGAGNSTTSRSYSFTDHVPTTGLNYYRLKQVDFDGRFKYSKVVAVNFEKGGRGIALYPNPVRNELTIDIAKPTGSMIVSIYSVDGKLVKRVNAGAVERSTTIRIDNLIPGTYVMDVRCDELSERMKVVKL